MKKRKIGFIALLGFLAVSAISVTTYAWFTQEKETADSVDFIAGSVKYSVTKLTSNDTKVVPGVDFLNGQAITFTNESTIDTQLRVQISYTIETADKNNDKKLTGSTFGTDDYIIWTSADTTKWVSEGGYYYYKAVDYTSQTDASKITVGESGFSFINADDTLELNGNKIGNDYQGATITITFTFQAKQYDALTWKDCADNSINFKTGLK